MVILTDLNYSYFKLEAPKFSNKETWLSNRRFTELYICKH